MNMGNFLTHASMDNKQTLSYRWYDWLFITHFWWWHWWTYIVVLYMLIYFIALKLFLYWERSRDLDTSFCSLQLLQSPLV